MDRIKITCDSTCDLTRDLYDENHVEVISMGINLGEVFLRDGINITSDELFSFVETHGKLPKTSALSIGEYEDVFRSYTDEGYQVIHISLSSELSSSYQNACLAAQEVGNVYVVDSRNLSSGSGHLVLLAREMANDGMTAVEIVKELNRKKELLDVSFVLQTLEYLHMGGRCSGLTAYGANVLKIRPEIQVADGKMHVGKKYRGEMEKSILAYVRGRLEGRTDIDHGRIFVTHTGVPKEIVEKVILLVKELQPFQEIIETNAGCTIASHCGPNCLGVLFFKELNEENC